MDFSNDPRRTDIEPMHEFMEIWADFWRDKPRYEVSITWLTMCSIRDWCNRVEGIREGIINREPVRIRRTDSAVIAEKMRKLLHDDKAWAFHAREREVLVTYYLKVHPSWPVGKIAKHLGCPRWKVDATVKDALFYLSTVWKD